RYFNAYGPRMQQTGYGSVIARFASQALSGAPLTVYDDGHQTRCFTYVSDTVEGTVSAASKVEAIGGVFNIGSTREITILEIARLICELTGSPLEIRFEPYKELFPSGFEEPRRRVPDMTRAREVLGFQARVTLEDGLTR